MEHVAADDKVKWQDAPPPKDWQDTAAPPGAVSAAPMEGGTRPSVTKDTPRMGTQPSMMEDIGSRILPHSLGEAATWNPIMAPITAIGDYIGDKLRQSTMHVPGTGVDVGQATKNAGEFSDIAGTEAGVLTLPMLGEDIAGGARKMMQPGGLARMFRSPKTGAVTLTPSSILDRIIPERPEVVDRMMGDTEQRMRTIENARQQELADKAQAHEKDLGGQISKAEEARQKELADKATAHEKDMSSRIDSAFDARMKELGDQGRIETQLGSESNAAIKRKEAQDAAQKELLSSKIVTPQMGVNAPRMTGSEGRAATWTNEMVLSEAAKGNREAIQQVTRRGLPMPSGARYVMGDADYPRSVYNPRETTRMGDTPVKNVMAPEKSSRDLIATPKETSGEQVPLKNIEEIKRALPKDWEYLGSKKGMPHEFKQKDTNISISVTDKNMNPDFVAKKIESKIKEFEKKE